MTPEELQAIKARAEAATPGPWKVETGSYTGWDWLIGSSGFDGKNYSVHLTTDSIHASQLYGDASTDAAFIAAAREAVPELVAEIERLRAALEEINNQHPAVYFKDLVEAEDMPDAVMRYDFFEQAKNIARRALAQDGGGK
jgi:hypothetical protein